MKFSNNTKMVLTELENRGIIQVSQMRNNRINIATICEIRGKEMMPTVPFQKIAEACRTTGLSQYFLRQGCKKGTIPHIKSGGVYYINVPALMETLGTKQNERLGY